MNNLTMDKAKAIRNPEGRRLSLPTYVVGLNNLLLQPCEESCEF